MSRVDSARGAPLAVPVGAPVRAGDGSAQGDGFAAALDRAAGGRWLVHGDGVRSRLPVDRWHGRAEPAVAGVVARCGGPTLDLGCGPGRLTVALTRAGLTAVGVDVSAAAVRLTRARGAVALHRDLFGPLPGEGRWSHAVLIDGNIGIGGEPVALLRRCRTLLASGGTVLVELEPPGPGLWQGQARVAAAHRAGGLFLGPAFRWARLDVHAVHPVAAAAGLVVRDLFRRGRRWFGELTAVHPLVSDPT
ncbi:class I SAM-dependent methyltransferase [Micromonospora sp. ZYX-F-536]|uniref:class I SAM-dependent methyltransferase n=1 Tax=Micromonospora sp. ZYX-F-536 TaxID=3457629 RepID=UPI0040409C4E